MSFTFVVLQRVRILLTLRLNFNFRWSYWIYGLLEISLRNFFLLSLYISLFCWNFTLLSKFFRNSLNFIVFAFFIKILLWRFLVFNFCFRLIFLIAFCSLSYGAWFILTIRYISRNLWYFEWWLTSFNIKFALLFYDLLWLLCWYSSKHLELSFNFNIFTFFF